ncbi:YceI family protein [Algimonas porphyrae]|uniref:Lipid/polyisoprenoid-binding YceI-like domain-containing protein n=1 Tax=Algimonas porphyrae TaxID=1128113 RepID=A0ABQ5V362_9PROT|nr:YceI family protein [Algimonas porphyrae]GLQ21110.1 hypothetical protein GCM10007854_20650 [Algimonas porphyrae]
MRAVILLFSILLCACNGGDVDPQPDTIERPVFEINYRVVPAESALTFTATQEGKTFEGAFSEFDAMIRFDADVLDMSRVWVVVAIDSLDAGHTDRNSTARTPAWLNVKDTPYGIFESETIRADGTGYVADGRLTLRGTSLPFSLPFALQETDGRAVMTAQVPLERLRWGIGEEWNKGDYVGLIVTLDIRVVAERTD